ncbi:MAG: hypothetical protein H7222_12055 [Methylotenera sp.]|nr:hypothetical protein [Oligoflexia bacterium]
MTTTRRPGKTGTKSETPRARGSRSGGDVRILRAGPAMRVIFFYPGEEGTYIDNAEVTLYENGIVHIKSNQEETTTHLQNCEILWNFEVDAEEKTSKVRLLKPAVGNLHPAVELAPVSSEVTVVEADTHSENPDLG